MALPDLLLSVVNEALLTLGESPLDTLDDDGTVPTVANALTQPKLDELLGGHPWSFNRKVERLARLADVPALATGFPAAYALPGLCFRIAAVYCDGGPLCDWGVLPGQLLLDAPAASAVELEFHTRADPQAWTPAFRQAAVLSLAAAYALPVTDTDAKAALMDKMASLALARARHLNAGEKPAIRIRTGRLAARMGR